MGAKLDAPMANALYTAISTDTGCFRYANTTSSTFAAAADCAKAGADIFSINQALFETESLNRLRLQGRLVENAKFYRDGKMVLCTIPYEWTREMGLTQDDTDNISGYPRTIAGVELASTIRENSDGSCKLSVRAIPGYDAAALCGTFGGGGHKGAAGATITLPLEETVKAVEAAMLAL
jgi:phosphoesterase RecJ-like protein